MVAIMATTLGLLTSSVLASPRPQPSPTVPKLRFALQAPDLDKLGLIPEQIQTVALTPDGRRLIIVSHRPGQNARLTEIDTSTHRRIADVDIDLLFVHGCGFNDDGTQVMAVGDYASKAVLIDVSAAKCTTVFTKDKSRFRFAFPVGLTHAPDGTFIARGYTVDEDGVTQGNEITALRIDPSGSLSTTRLVDIDALIAGSGVPKGQLLAFNRSRDGQRLVYSVASSVDACTLFVSNLSDRGIHPTKVLDAERVGYITMSADDACFWCIVRRAGEGELVEADLKTGKTRSLGHGTFTPTLIGDGGRLLITGVIAPRLNGHDLCVAIPSVSGKLVPLAIDGWNGRMTIYSVASRANVFSLWSKDRIWVGSMGK